MRPSSLFRGKSSRNVSSEVPSASLLRRSSPQEAILFRRRLPALYLDRAPSSRSDLFTTCRACSVHADVSQLQITLPARSVRCVHASSDTNILAKTKHAHCIAILSRFMGAYAGSTALILAPVGSACIAAQLAVHQRSDRVKLSKITESAQKLPQHAGIIGPLFFSS